MREEVNHLSLVFANKGDFGSTAGRGEDHFKSEGDLPSANNLNGAIARDAKAIKSVPVLWQMSSHSLYTQIAFSRHPNHNYSSQAPFHKPLSAHVDPRCHGN